MIAGPPGRRKPPPACVLASPVMPAARPPTADPLVALADQCVQCGLCLPACPKDLFTLYPRSHRIELACVARDKQATVRAACLVGCTLCRKCVAKCPAQAITWDGRTILIDHEKCLAYGPACGEVCVDVCPSVILHRRGQAPRPEPVAVAVPVEV